MTLLASTVSASEGYNGKPLIKDIEIQLGKGQILTLIGPNGSGKSTILKTITKHLKSIYGTVYITNIGERVAYVETGELPEPHQ